MTTTWTTETHTAWVCVDCHLAVAGYDEHETGRPMPEPFSTDETVTGVVNGSPIEECDTPECATAVADGDCDYTLHDECDHDSFSLAPCDGCGSTLAGDRYAVTVTTTSWGE